MGSQMRDLDNKSIKKEKAALRSIGAKPHPNSGRGHIKADGSTDLFVIDVKHADKSFTINAAVWSKICSDAMSVDKTKSPMLYLVLGGKTRLAVIEYSALEELLGE